MTWRSDSSSRVEGLPVRVTRRSSARTADSGDCAGPSGLSLLRQSQRQRIATPGRSAPIARLVGNDRQQPGSERGSGLEASQGAEGFHETLLGGVLRVVRTARDDPGGADCDLLVGTHERLEGGNIATPRPLDQLRLDWCTCPPRSEPMLRRDTRGLSPATERWAACVGWVDAGRRSARPASPRQDEHRNTDSERGWSARLRPCWNWRRHDRSADGQCGRAFHDQVGRVVAERP